MPLALHKPRPPHGPKQRGKLLEVGAASPATAVASSNSVSVADERLEGVAELEAEPTVEAMADTADVDLALLLLLFGAAIYVLVGGATLCSAWMWNGTT